MRWSAETPEGVRFTIESDRWYEARRFAERYGCTDVREVIGSKEPADFVLAWQGSDAKAMPRFVDEPRRLALRDPLP